MEVLPYKRAYIATAYAAPARALGSHQGRVVGALAGLLSCLPGCPTTCGFLFSLGAARLPLFTYLQTRLLPPPRDPHHLPCFSWFSCSFFPVSCQPSAFPSERWCLQARRCGCTDKT